MRWAATFAAAALAGLAAVWWFAVALDPTGRPERADSHPIVGRYDKDCPVCGFGMLGTSIVHTTKNRWAHTSCVDAR